MPTKEERLAAVDELEQLFLDYVSEEKTRVENEIEFLQNVLEGRTGGLQTLQIKNVEEAAIFAVHEINYYLGG